MTADNGLDGGVLLPCEPQGERVNDIDLGIVHGPPELPKKVPVWVLKGEKPKGRPSKAQVKAEKKLKVIEQRNQPPGGPVKSWGGKRRGAGRPRRQGPPARKIAMVRMDRPLAEALESLPAGQRSEYVRQALDLMKDLQPPEKFVASGRKKDQTGEVSVTS